AAGTGARARAGRRVRALLRALGYDRADRRGARVLPHGGAAAAAAGAAADLVHLPRAAVAHLRQRRRALGVDEPLPERAVLPRARADACAADRVAALPRVAVRRVLVGVHLPARRTGERGGAARPPRAFAAVAPCRRRDARARRRVRRARSGEDRVGIPARDAVRRAEEGV